MGIQSNDVIAGQDVGKAICKALGIDGLVKKLVLTIECQAVTKIEITRMPTVDEHIKIAEAIVEGVNETIQRPVKWAE